MPNPCVILLVNLLQDVNILRPLAYIASRDLGLDTQFFLTRDFEKRDKGRRWQAEIAEIGQALGTPIKLVENEGHALQLLQGLAGVIIAASESNLSGHRIVHNIFRLKPPSFVAITLQHGFECVGFLQSSDHDRAHGREVTFAADIICGWCPPERLTALAPSQYNKLYVTGPTAVLQQPPRQERKPRGIVCENLHSVRLNISGDFKADFVTLFREFCEALEQDEKRVVLRPHPGGQYVIKNDLLLPQNVIINNNPIYKVNLSRYTYGISAPSSVLIDMVLAGIPTAVWRERTGVMDANNYEGLTGVSDLADWLEFEREASAHPERFIDRQSAFLENQKILINRSEVYRRFAELLWATARRAAPDLRRPPAPATAGRRILFVANGNIPTLQLSFIKPLTPLIDAGDVAVEILTEEQIKDTFGPNMREHDVQLWLDERLKVFKPTAIVFCRYSGPYVAYLTGRARDYGIPVIFHVDDDLLNIPVELGVVKHAFHTHPTRLAAVRRLLDTSDLVYSSTQALKTRFETLGAKAPVQAGEIYASGKVFVEATEKLATKIGYMGFDHAHDLETVLPVLVRFLRTYPHIRFELFGSIPKPAVLEEFGDRISVVQPVRNYEEFLIYFSKLGWDIGICPLAHTPFNVVKANTKWVEYTSMGIATIATARTVYDNCCADGCGILADTDEEWFEALKALVSDAALRARQVMHAQAKLRQVYSVDRLREQVLSVIETAEKITMQPRDREAHDAKGREAVLLKRSERWLHVTPRPPVAVPGPRAKRRRVLFVANDYIPTLQLSFIKPLAPLIESDEISTDFIIEKKIREEFGKSLKNSGIIPWLKERLHSFNPTAIVFCRYSGSYAEFLTEWARKRGIPVIYHIDDDILNVPMELGEVKHAYHNDPKRLAAVRHLLDKSDLVYCSNSNLKNRLEESGARSVLKAGKIYASGMVIVPAQDKKVLKIGYMASADHAHNLEMIKPAIVHFLRQNPTVKFELFGSIPKLEEFKEFGERVSNCPPINDYEKFMASFALLGWDIGICPLVRTPFNVVKSNTKWVEYTSVGAAVVASRDTVYDECCADGCGLLADTPDEWLEALNLLANDNRLRYAQVTKAQLKLASEYSTDRLRDQVLSFFNEAESLKKSRLIQVS
jgi:glycosyltransferase involved in cell wall biosynthesis